MDFLRELRLVFVFIGCTRLAGSDYPMDTKFLTLSGDASAFMNTGHAIAMLKEYGYIVLDSRMVITAPDVYMKKPSDLIVGAPNMDDAPSGYTPPNLLKGVKGDAQQH